MRLGYTLLDTDYTAREQICRHCHWWEADRCTTPLGPCECSLARTRPWHTYPICPAGHWTASPAPPLRKTPTLDNAGKKCQACIQSQVPPIRAFNLTPKDI
jgi:hypothetical protein